MPARDEIRTHDKGARMARLIGDVLCAKVVGEGHEQIVAFPFGNLIRIEPPEFHRGIGLIWAPIECLGQRES